MTQHLILIILMGIVTFIPRYLPLVLLKDQQISNRVKKFLFYIPYTSLTILITRGLLSAKPSEFLASFVSIITVGMIAYYKNNLIVSVLFSIVVAFIILH